MSPVNHTTRRTFGVSYWRKESNIFGVTNRTWQISPLVIRCCSAVPSFANLSALLSVCLRRVSHPEPPAREDEDPPRDYHFFVTTISFVIPLFWRPGDGVDTEYSTATQKTRLVPRHGNLDASTFTICLGGWFWESREKDARTGTNITQTEREQAGRSLVGLCGSGKKAHIWPEWGEVWSVLSECPVF